MSLFLYSLFIYANWFSNFRFKNRKQSEVDSQPQYIPIIVLKYLSICSLICASRNSNISTKSFRLNCTAFALIKSQNYFIFFFLSFSHFLQQMHATPQWREKRWWKKKKTLSWNTSPLWHLTNRNKFLSCFTQKKTTIHKIHFNNSLFIRFTSTLKSRPSDGFICKEQEMCNVHALRYYWHDLQ